MSGSRKQPNTCKFTPTTGLVRSIQGGKSYLGWEMRDGAMEDEGGWICFLMMVLEGDSCASDFDLPSVWEPDARAVCGSILPPSFSTCQLSNFPLPTTSSGRQPSRTPFRVTRTTPPSMVAASPQHSMDGSSMSFIYLFICPPFNAPACPRHR